MRYTLSQRLVAHLLLMSQVLSSCTKNPLYYEPIEPDPSLTSLPTPPMQPAAPTTPTNRDEAPSRPLATAGNTPAQHPVRYAPASSTRTNSNLILPAQAIENTQPPATDRSAPVLPQSLVDQPITPVPQPAVALHQPTGQSTNMIPIAPVEESYSQVHTPAPANQVRGYSQLYDQQDPYRNLPATRSFATNPNLTKPAKKQPSQATTQTEDPFQAQQKLARHIASTKRDKQAISSITPSPATVADAPAPFPWQPAREGYQVQFSPSTDTVTAWVREPFTQRLLHLPVYQEENFAHQSSSSYANWPQRAIQVCPPEKDTHKKGYVYVGNWGLLGGGTANIKEARVNPLEGFLGRGNVVRAISLISNPDTDPYAFLQPPSATLQTPAIIRNVNQLDQPGIPPLIAAIDNNQLPKVMRLISLGADIQATDQDGNTPLHAAAVQGNLEIVHLLLTANCNPNISNVHGNTPVHLATFRGHRYLIPLLAAAGASLVKRNKQGQTPLEIAIGNNIKKIDIDLVRALLQAGADPNQKTAQCFPLLHTAINAQDLTLTQLLIQAGADPNIMEPAWHKTPLHIAISSSHAPMVYLLKKLGASDERANLLGVTPLQHILTRTNQLRKRYSTVSYATFGNLPEVDPYRQLLHALGRQGRCLTHSIENCGSCWENFTQNYTAPTLNTEPLSPPSEQPIFPLTLHQAIERGELGVAKMLANQAKDINEQDDQGRTPLQLAFEKSHILLAIYLLRLGGRPLYQRQTRPDAPPPGLPNQATFLGRATLNNSIHGSCSHHHFALG